MSQELGDSATKHGFRPRCHPEISAKKKQSSELRIPWNPRRIQNSKSPSKNGKGPTFGASSGKCVFFKNNKKPSLDIPGPSTPRDLFHVVFLVRISSRGDQIFEMCLPAIASSSVAGDGMAFMLVFKTMFQTNLQTTAAALAGIREGELLFASLHWTPRLCRLHSRNTGSTGSMSFQQRLLIAVGKTRDRHVAEWTHNHATVLVTATLAALMGFILDMLSAVRFATSIAIKGQQVLLLAIRIRAMLSAVAEICHFNQGRNRWNCLN